MTSIILRRRKLGRGSALGIEAKSTTGIRAARNDQFPDQSSGHPGYHYVFRWGCTSTVTAEHIVNTAKSIHWCSDKRQGRLDMQAAGVPVPRTWGAEVLYLEYQLDERGGLFVLRPPQHAQGRRLYVGTAEELRNLTRQERLIDGYVSELIDKVAEYRVFVCQNRAVWVAKKTPGNPDDVAWNVAQGGRFDNVRWGEWPLSVVKAALAAAKVSGTDFCGVDVMADAEGNPYVLEVNSAPSQTSEYRQSCVAKAFDYIVTNGKEHFCDVPERSSNTWKSYIHPALWS